MAETKTPDGVQTEELIYALDVGTRSVIGMVGRAENGRARVLAVEKQPHPRRAMLDGQIEDIAQVAQVVEQVTRRLEERMGLRLERACVAAAGRALRTEQGHGVLKLPETGKLGEEQLGQLEATAVADAEQHLREGEDQGQRLFLVGYTVTRFLLDGYPMTSLLGHTGRNIEADVVATFLPGEVVDSLYAVLREAGLEVASLTLEPIAALNAAIPAELRLLNLALVDIGAGTSDIAICREGSVVGYTMATVAGDEITEALMRTYLVDYRTAEEMKAALGQSETITFTDILGMEQTCGAEEVLDAADQAGQSLVDEVAARVLELNGGAPSALLLAGGGSKLSSLREKMAQALGMDPRRVALAGAHFKTSAFSDTVELEDPEYTTHLGIAVSAGLELISDSYRILLNDRPAKLFRNGRLTLLELLMMNGYGYRDLLGRNGKSAVLEVDSRRVVFHGEPSQPAVLEVNGAPARPFDVIHAGDKIRFVPATPGADRKVTVREVLERLGAQSLLADGAPLAPEDEVPVGVRLQTGAAPVAEKPEPPAVSEPERPVVESCRLTLNGRTLLLPPKPEGGPYYLMDLLERSGIDFEHLDRPVRLAVNGQAGAFQQVLRPGDQVEIRYEA
ncbi:cell division FtsA domain-containing protein [Intestinimonas timonensis]|uniref:cell division FtsA domain-containing protein n=1 Tax=Intestinimonas timonensis TaxID=1689270 RepID=UPI001031BF0C|nr:cell division FtsA domain-containing protein [Intestinimonas timonensis]